MLAWVVIDRTYPRQFLPKSSSLRTLCLCVEFSDSLRPTSVVPTTYALPLATAAPQPLCNQSVTHSSYLDGGCIPQCIPPCGAALTTAILSNAYPMFPISFIFNPVRTLLHFFALPKNSTLLFSSDSALCVKKLNRRAWGRGQFASGKYGNSFRRYILTSLHPASSPEREQHRLPGRTIRNGLEFRVLPAQRLRHFYLRSLQDADELQGIDDGLALKVIVGDHKRLASPFRDFADARDPGS